MQPFHTSHFEIISRKSPEILAELFSEKMFNLEKNSSIASHNRGQMCFPCPLQKCSVNFDIIVSQTSLEIPEFGPFRFHGWIILDNFNVKGS